jgi:hypothetical protein
MVLKWIRLWRLKKNAQIERKTTFGNLKEVYFLGG